MYMSFYRSSLFSSNWSQLQSNRVSDTGGAPKCWKFLKYSCLIASLTEIRLSGEKLSIFCSKSNANGFA